MEVPSRVSSRRGRSRKAWHRRPIVRFAAALARGGLDQADSMQSIPSIRSMAAGF